MKKRAPVFHITVAAKIDPPTAMEIIEASQGASDELKGACRTLFEEWWAAKGQPWGPQTIDKKTGLPGRHHPGLFEAADLSAVAYHLQGRVGFVGQLLVDEEPFRIVSGKVGSRGEAVVETAKMLTEVEKRLPSAGAAIVFKVVFSTLRVENGKVVFEDEVILEAPVRL